MTGQEHDIKDAKVMEYFELYQKYQKIHVDLCNFIKLGCFDFSQARNQMGQDYINIDHIPQSETIRPLYTVNLKDNQLNLTDHQVHTSNESTKPEFIESTTTLRKRKGIISTERENVAQKEEEKKVSSAYKEELSLKQKDPIHWFGVMFVSEHLVSAQKNFRKGLQDVVRLANIKIQMQKLEEELRQIE